MHQVPQPEVIITAVDTGLHTEQATMNDTLLPFTQADIEPLWLVEKRYIEQAIQACITTYLKQLLY